MNKLAQALEETFGVVLEKNDRVECQHNYCGYEIVDVVVNGEYTFLAYDTVRGCFPY